MSTPWFTYRTPSFQLLNFSMWLIQIHAIAVGCHEIFMDPSKWFQFLPKSGRFSKDIHWSDSNWKKLQYSTHIRVAMTSALACVVCVSFLLHCALWVIVITRLISLLSKGWSSLGWGFLLWKKSRTMYYLCPVQRNGIRYLSTAAWVLPSTELNKINNNGRTWWPFPHL